MLSGSMASTTSKDVRARAGQNRMVTLATLAIEADGLLDELGHPNAEKYPNQSILVVALDGYVYLVSYVEEAGYYFLKTIIPSRKATRDYLLRNKLHEKT